MTSSLLVASHFTLVSRSHAIDEYPWIIVLSGIGFVWVPVEIIWSHHALARLVPVIRAVTREVDADRVGEWFLMRVHTIYALRNMCLSGTIAFLLFGAFTVIEMTPCWVPSRSVCLYDVLFYAILIFLGGMSQFPFYGMSLLVYRLPRLPIDRVNLFLHPSSNIMRVGQLMLQVGLGGIGLILVTELMIYTAPLPTRNFVYYQLLLVVVSLGTLAWFIVTQVNVHLLMRRTKKDQFDAVSTQLFESLAAATRNPSQDAYYRISTLTKLRDEIAKLPEWPFDSKALASMISGSVSAAVVPASQLIKAFVIGGGSKFFP